VADIAFPKYDERGIDRVHSHKTYEIRYLAKSPDFEVCLALSASPDSPGTVPAVVQVRFARQPQQHSITLTLDELEAFYKTLGPLLDYLQQEHRRAQRQ
jgi:hypothetical protein